jgi:hypothetical protein
VSKNAHQGFVITFTGPAGFHDFQKTPFLEVPLRNTAQEES